MRSSAVAEPPFTRDWRCHGPRFGQEAQGVRRQTTDLPFSEQSDFSGEEASVGPNT